MKVQEHTIDVKLALLASRHEKAVRPSSLKINGAFHDIARDFAMIVAVKSKTANYLPEQGGEDGALAVAIRGALDPFGRKFRLSEKRTEALRSEAIAAKAGCVSLTIRGRRVRTLDAERLVEALSFVTGSVSIHIATKFTRKGRSSRVLIVGRHNGRAVRIAVMPMADHSTATTRFALPAESK